VTGELTIADFDEFFREVNGDGPDRGPDPFPWQSRLARQVAATGEWPALLDLPTGSGKTAVIDIAVFVLALRADQPRRMVFVVDRRIVVHQAAQRARHIAERLRDAKDGVTHRVAERLLRLTASIGVDDDPLQYAELRGGIVRDDDWARRPDTPTVLVSTVDQVGSRLLFRGYGVSEGMRPVHAGLLGNDVLYFLDEVHLARPFADTLDAIGRRYRPPAGSDLPNRWAVVELSATPAPSERAGDVLELDDDDRDPDRAGVLVRRLGAHKLARTELVKTGAKADHRGELASAAVRNARRLLADPGIRTVGVVVNRVETAVGVYRRLKRESPEVEAVLLTGRMRPLERDAILARYEPRLRTGRVRSDDDPPLVVVATMAIEAGADIDLDALVTECASLGALVQRFGRVDRGGDLTASGHRPTSIILATSVDVADKADDPVYGPALAATWAWLHDRSLDFGIDVLAKVPRPAELTRAPDRAPQLLPSHLDRWVQTSTTPDADPDPAHWLHGLSPSRAEVSVVWRADVLPDAFDQGASERLVRLVSLCPPGSGEAMQLPISAVRAWLAARRDDRREPVGADTSVADVPDAVIGTSDPLDGRPSGTYALKWRGDGSTLLGSVHDIKPGDTIVVPTSYGGIRAGCWDPGSADAVSDFGTQIQAMQRGRAVLRLLPACLPYVPEQPPPPRPEASLDLDDQSDELVSVQEWLSSYGERLAAGDPALEEPRDWVARVVRALRPLRGRQVELAVVDLTGGADPQRMFVLRSRRRLAALAGRGSGSGVDSEPTTSPFAGKSLGLDEHLEEVERIARELATAAGLPEALAEDVGRAARLHDLGKVDPRFQAMLRGGQLIDSELGLTALAKSGVERADYAARQRARNDAGYPAQARHELGSVALVQHDGPLQAEATDWDLVLHLIASHHGYARPFVPVADDPQPPGLSVEYKGRTLTAPGDHGLMRLDSGVPQRFWRCVRRYGWWGLAWLEALLRLADHRASEKAQDRDDRRT
jgi:CRISPR-associated endonuclease/helicase Cas3